MFVLLGWGDVFCGVEKVVFRLGFLIDCKENVCNVNYLYL